jgi:transposase
MIQKNKHTSAIVKDWLKKNRIETLPWPSFSPDLNLIENLWDELERRLKKHHPKNKSELEMLLIQEWSNIEVSVLAKLVDSVPSRLNECIKMKGYPTRY